jgi:hypothetical protein
MPRSEFVRALDEVQQRLAPMLREHGYKKRGRTYNRISADGLTLVINLRMGPFEPPVRYTCPIFGRICTASSQ